MFFNIFVNFVKNVDGNFGGGDFKCRSNSLSHMLLPLWKNEVSTKQNYLRDEKPPQMGKKCFLCNLNNPLKVDFPNLLELTLYLSFTTSTPFSQWDVIRLVPPQRSRLNFSGLLLHSSTLMLTPPAVSQCRLSQQHPPPRGQRGGGGCGASSADNTRHPRRKHGWQMGHHIRYQVSAWKIYKVTRQWEADTKSFSTTARTHFSFSSRGENHFPCNPLSFPIRAAQIRCSHTAESEVWGMFQSTDWRQRSLGSRRLVVTVKMKEVLTHGKGSSGSGGAWPGNGWRRQLSMTSCFAISSCSTYTSPSRKLLTCLRLQSAPGRFVRFSNTCKGHDRFVCTWVGGVCRDRTVGAADLTSANSEGV